MRTHRLALAVAAAVAAGGSLPALGQDSPHSFSANIGAVTNYLWRGVTQTDDGPAIQGGVDYAHSSGFYLGTWLSNVDFGTPDPNYELDLYGGFGGSAGDFGYDIHTVYYAYPDAEGDANFWELGASGTWKFLTVGLDYTLDGEVSSPAPFNSGDLYFYGSLAFDLPRDFSLGGTLGHYDFDDFGGAADYTHWQVSLSKAAGDFGTFSLNYDQNDGGEGEIVALDDDPKFSVGWLKEF